MKAKVNSVSIGNFDVDSIATNLNGVETQICFSKDVNVLQYDGKEIELVKKDGIYIIEGITKNK